MFWLLGLNLLVMSSLLLGAPAAKDTAIPAGLQTAIEVSRHALERDGAGYKASNPGQQLDLRFEPSGAWVQAAETAVWIRLVGYGRGSQRVPPAAAALRAAQNRVEYRQGAMTEWYVNDRRGLEQGFTLGERPGGAGPLEVALAVEGDLEPRLEGTDAVVLERGGWAVLRYGGLKAWDARGRTLASRMEVRGKEICLVVEDSGAAYPVTIDPWLQQAKLIPADGVLHNSFGGSVALSGDTALVGAEKGGTGAAYVYVRSGTAWTQQAKLTAADGVPGDRFGYSVALSGDTALVGAPFADGQFGVAYVYVRSGTAWAQQAKLSDIAGPEAYFGTSVALSGDTALVGAPNADNGPGATYVYVRSGTAWTQQAKLTASDGVVGVEVEGFGESVALSGNTALVGAPGKAAQTGAAYVYVRSGAAWTEQAKLIASDGVVGLARFGTSVALSGDTALVGAPRKASDTGATYVYVRSGALWTQQAKLTALDSMWGDSFGDSVVVSGDTALVGASHKASYRGAAYVYTRSGTAWTQQAKLAAADGEPGSFGTSMALSGGTVLVGASNIQRDSTGAAYVYVRSEAAANLSSTPTTGSAGVPLSLTGNGFGANETVSFVYRNTAGNTIALGTASADATGAFIATVPFPQTPYGSGFVDATGQSSRKVGSSNFSVAPRLIMNPAAGPVGSSMVAQGFGFGEGETVVIGWVTPSGLLRPFLGTVTADSNGSFYQSTGLTFTIPAAAPVGINAVVGGGLTTEAAGRAFVTVQ